MLLLELAQSLLTAQPQELHLLVTHDLILSTMVARIRGTALAESEWPGYFHGVAVWYRNGRLMVQYDGAESFVPGRLMSVKPSERGGCDSAS